MIKKIKKLFTFTINFGPLHPLQIDYFLFVTSIGVLITLLIPSTFWLVFANIYLIFLSRFYNYILKTNKFVQITIVLWLLSLLLYSLTFFVPFDETYIGVILFAIRRFVFFLIFMITLITIKDLPAVQIFQADCAVFDEGPSNKSPFLAAIRKYHILIIFSSFISYSLATSIFVTNPLIATFFGVVTFGFAALYLVQFIVYLISFWRKPLDKLPSISSKKSLKKKNDPRGQTRTMFSGMTAHMTNPGVRKLAVTCMECAKGLGTIMVGGEMMYKLSAGGMNAVSPPRQFMLNNMFPDDRTKYWTESKAAYALHNRAMGNPHDKIYQMQDMWNMHGPILQQTKPQIPKKD